MQAPYDAAGELTTLTRWIDNRLADESASRQYTAEQASKRLKDIVAAMRAAHESSARRAAAMPPVEDEEHAGELPAALAARAAYSADPGPGTPVPHNRRILTGALGAAGVDLGGYDEFILEWLATTSNPETCAVVAGWVTRAAAAGLGAGVSR